MEVLISILLVLGIAISLRTRIKMMRWRSPQSSGTHSSSSLAKAITQLVGTAGGIYLSLELMLTFLGVPEDLWNPSSLYYFKPLALFSLFVAIFQPYVQQLLLSIRKRRE